jgi:anti-anti-sigma factor
MEVKTSTKEKFHVIAVVAPHLSAGMAEELCSQLQQYLQDTPRNVVVNLKMLNLWTTMGPECLVRSQQGFYDNGASFVVCELTPEVERFLDNSNLLELMNVTPPKAKPAILYRWKRLNANCWMRKSNFSVLIDTDGQSGYLTTRHGVLKKLLQGLRSAVKL